MKALILSVALIFAPRSWAEVKYPNQVDFEGHTYFLRGWGYRTATWLKVKVYHAGLYQEILKSDPLKDGASLIDLTFTHKVSAEDMRKAWDFSVKKNCVKPCVVPADEFHQYLNSQGDAKEGDKFRYVFGPDSLIVIPPQGAVAKYSRGFAMVILSTWLGPFPPTEALKQALLGVKP